jgi:hypothetical protein
LVAFQIHAFVLLNGVRNLPDVEAALRLETHTEEIGLGDCFGLDADEAPTTRPTKQYEGSAFVLGLCLPERVELTAIATAATGLPIAEHKQIARARALSLRRRARPQRLCVKAQRVAGVAIFRAVIAVEYGLQTRTRCDLRTVALDCSAISISHSPEEKP